jgi:hypothetical protein
MLDYEGISVVTRRVNGGVRSVDLVYIKDENRIATWMGDSPDPECVWLREVRTYTMPNDRWEFDMLDLYMVFKIHISLENAWCDFLKKMKDKLPEFDYWEKI